MYWTAQFPFPQFPLECRLRRSAALRAERASSSIHSQSAAFRVVGTLRRAVTLLPAHYFAVVTIGHGTTERAYYMSLPTVHCANAVFAGPWLFDPKKA